MGEPTELVSQARFVGSTLFVVGALRDALEGLGADEQPLASCACALQGRKGVVMVTNKRVLFRSRMFWVMTTEAEVPREKVSGATKAGTVVQRVSVASSGLTLELENMSRAGADAIVGALRR